MVNKQFKHGDRKPPKDRGQWDPFQVCFSWFVNRGYYLLTNWDDPPSMELGFMDHETHTIHGTNGVFTDP